MRRKLYLLTAILSFVQLCFAQERDTKFYYHGNRTANASLAPHIDVSNSTGQSGTGSNIDIKYHKVWWRINPDSIVTVSSVKRGYIKGWVQTNFLTTQNNVSSISFDLNSALTVDSVRYRGAKLPGASIVSSGNVLTLTLGVTLANNVLDSIWIYYKGITPAVNGTAQGYQYTSVAGAGNIINTLSESYEDRDWWPCKADMQDKIDSMDISVNVPWATPTAADTFWVASNGVLIDSAISGSSRTFKFKTRYPIASYLVCVSVAHYQRYYKGVNINGTNVPVVYYLLSGKTAATYTSIVTAMDKINLVLAAFSAKFGDYPFKLEKHGFYDGLVGAGGMEHQTFSAIDPTALTDLRTLAHELMHQWFGDNVTFSTWNDLWLAEGFARYSEVLCGELVPSLGLNPYTIRNSFKTSALGYTANSAWIPNANASTSNLIWSSTYGSTVYQRGCMVVSMLRALAGDTKFFQACTNYQTALAGKSATTDSLKNYFNAVLGADISEFFNDYAGGSGNGAIRGGIGNPINTVNWYSPSAKKLAIKITGQAKSAGSNVTYFNGPVVLHVKGTVPVAMDTTIVVYDWGGGNLSYAGNGLSAPIPGNLLTYNLSATPTSVQYDDSARTLSTGVITNNLIVLATTVVDFSGRKKASGNELSLTLNSTDPITKVELQKSNNGTDFVAAGSMNLLNPGSQTMNYNFTDGTPYTAATFYRAKIYYLGKEELTNIVKIQSAQLKEISVSPNPANKELRVNIDNPAREEFKVRIVNAEGKQIKETTTNSDFIHFDTSDLPAGIYMVQVVQQGQVAQTSKFLVRH
ncbi:M1 family aminopeptidase [Ferruginibacter sp. SUN106]|uniref:M1 family aminopeptidase n=1 Tax=Ferruginibacter sp. SUN106 TaxID=2978348 RepID=UPI003D36851E